jgi:hypothetical protein
MGLTNRQAEDLAARVVKTVTGLQPIRRAPSPPQKQFDFELHGGVSGIGALEVTVAADRLRRKMYAALDKHAGCSSKPASLSWTVYMAEASKSVAVICRDLPAMLHELEQLGVNYFHYGRTIQPELEVIARIYRSCGVDGGMSHELELGEAGQLTILEPGEGGGIGPGAVASVVEEQAARKTLQLSVAQVEGIGERHLFIWLDSTRYLVLESFRRGNLADTPVQIPDEVTDVWVGASGVMPQHVTVWRFSGPGGWRLELDEVPWTSLATL